MLLHLFLPNSFIHRTSSYVFQGRGGISDCPDYRVLPENGQPGIPLARMGIQNECTHYACHRQRLGAEIGKMQKDNRAGGRHGSPNYRVRGLGTGVEGDCFCRPAGGLSGSCDEIPLLVAGDRENRDRRGVQAAFGVEKALFAGQAIRNPLAGIAVVLGEGEEEENSGVRRGLPVE